MVVVTTDKLKRRLAGESSGVESPKVVTAEHALTYLQWRATMLQSRYYGLTPIQRNLHYAHSSVGLLPVPLPVTVCNPNAPRL